MEIIEWESNYPNRWSEKFIKTNVTMDIKQKYSAKTAKCIKFEKFPDSKQKLTYEVIKWIRTTQP